MSKHAVITDTSIVMIKDGERKLTGYALQQSATHISQLWDMTRSLGITHLWVMPGSILDKAGSSALTPVEGFEMWQASNMDGTPFDEPQSGMMRKKGVELIVCYPHRGGFSWVVDKPLDILATVDYLENELNVTVEWSPRRIGMNLFRSYHENRKHQEWIASREQPMDEMLFNSAGRDVQFYKPMTLDMVGKYLHQYDKNSAYLSAATGITSGCGDAVYIKGEPSGPTQQGIYHVEIVDTTWPDHLPPIIDTRWVTADVMKYARRNGYTLLVTECYVFTEAHTILGKWAQRIWDARVTFKTGCYPYEQGRENAYHTMKQIALVSLGSFAMQKKHSLSHHNWWAEVVGLARVRILANIAKYEAHGCSLQFVKTDALYYVSSESNPEEAVNGILDRSESLGGYKHAYSLLLTEEIVRTAMMFEKQALLGYLKHQAFLQNRGVA